MQNNSCDGSYALFARGFMALFAIMLAMGQGLLASPAAEAAPFAYVTNQFSNTVSVIDTATNTVVATIPVPGVPMGSPSPRMGSMLCHGQRRFGD